MSIDEKCGAALAHTLESINTYLWYGILPRREGGPLVPFGLGFDPKSMSKDPSSEPAN